MWHVSRWIKYQNKSFWSLLGTGHLLFLCSFLERQKLQNRGLGVMVQTILSDPFFLYSLKRSIGLAILGEARKNVAELILSELYGSESMISYVETGAGGGSNIPYSSYLNIPIDYKKYY
jgi:hypothetical protein